MNPSEYIQKALRTESPYRFEATGGVTARIEHGVMGVVGEAGELMDAVKKSKFNGRVFDRVNLVEEIGDVMWYLALLADELGVSFEEIWEKNINKLRQRYPEKYSVEQSEHRDLASERKILET
jgi:NTP pyrophosphatase (non-canonical NTP hydrolase)